MKLSVKICYGKYIGQKKIKKIRNLPSSQDLENAWPVAKITYLCHRKPQIILKALVSL